MQTHKTHDARPRHIQYKEINFLFSDINFSYQRLKYIYIYIYKYLSI